MLLDGDVHTSGVTGNGQGQQIGGYGGEGRGAEIYGAVEGGGGCGGLRGEQIG